VKRLRIHTIGVPTTKDNHVEMVSGAMERRLALQDLAKSILLPARMTLSFATAQNLVMKSVIFVYIPGIRVQMTGCSVTALRVVTKDKTLVSVQVNHAL